MKSLGDLEIYAYVLDKEDDTTPVLLFRLKDKIGHIRWAIRCGCYCMNKKGEWELEPQPSSRSVAFYKRCRFMQSDEAYYVYKKSRGE